MFSHFKVSRFAIAAFSSTLTVFVITYLILDGNTVGNNPTQRTVRKDSLRHLWEYKLNFTTKLGNLSSKEIVLFGRLRSVQESCGDVCNTSIKGVPGRVSN